MSLFALLLVEQQGKVGFDVLLLRLPIVFLFLLYGTYGSCSFQQKSEIIVISAWVAFL